MADTEEYFPRGGKKPSTQYYKPSSNFLGAIEKGEYKKKKPKKKSEGDDGYLSDEFNTEFEIASKNCAIGISYKTVKEGLLLLGRVRQVLETKIQVSLPCRMTGTVMACHVSEPYNKMLEAYVNDQVEGIKELPSMFRVGQYVAVRVLEVESSHLMLSLMPQHVNSGKLHTDIVKGTLFQAAVSSIEDHGYVMDLGINNTRAFLPKANANEEIVLDTGVITWCTVKSFTPSADNSIVTLNNQLSALQEAVVKRDPVRGISGMLPGSAVEFIVDKALENGIEGHIFKGTTSYIQREHADNIKGKKPALGQRVRARFLYEMPTRKSPFLTMRNIFENTYPDLSNEQKYQEGDIVDDAQVIKITGRSITFKLGNKCMGVMSLKRIYVDEELTDEEVVAKSYPLGSEHKVRILCYNLSDYRYSVSDQADILHEKYFSLTNLSVGDIVDGTVKAVSDNYLVLNIGRLTGVVPQMHMSDAGIYVDPKKASISKLSKKKFKVGQGLQARVLFSNPDNNNLVLTLKPSLLSSELDVLSSYQDARVGKTYTGFIKLIKDYILVSFFNHVVAYVPKHYVSKEPLDNLADAFHLGQIVNCTILRVEPETNKMSGSLITLPFDPSKKIDKAEKRPWSKEPSAEIQIESNKNDNEEPLKKKKKRKGSESSETSETKNKRKKTKKTELCSHDNKFQNASEESDAIETDIHEDTDNAESILTEEDKQLINIDDCVTPKQIKKRAAILKKSIANRTKRLHVVKRKIDNMLSIGLNTKNKSLHTAMESEKLILEERIKLLLNASNKTQEKIQKIPEEEVKGYKRKKQVEDVNSKTKEIITIDKIEDIKQKTLKNATNEKIKSIKVAEELSPALDLPSVKDFWSINADVLSKNVQRLKDDKESSSSEDEIKEQPKKKRKKLSVAEKVAKVREEEERVRELERKAIESESRPQSIAQFERALLANPNSSELWIAYMAFHLQATEIEKARAVGRKALSIISFREEEEKLNVWLAMINFENRFGTKESQQKTLEEALQMNDTFKIHSKLLDIYVETSKTMELNSLVELMLRKYKRDPQTYIMCGSAAYKLGLVDKARHVMQKAISVLEKKEHVSVLVQFALLERSLSSRERSEALFEQVLGAYPQRVDVCCTYIDMLYKNNDIEHVRQVMDRMTSQKLPARKMKVLYKKWIEVEEKIGEQEQIDRVREKAMEFIEKAQF